jgi:hypothetical protein
LTSLCVCLFFFAALLSGLEMGRRFRVRSAAERTDGASAIDGAIFALMGLLVAFTFSGAASRFDTRRQLIVEEANDIGTAYLRIDTMVAENQSVMREKFRQYVQSRLDFYAQLHETEKAAAQLEKSNKLQAEIWSLAITDSRQEKTLNKGMLLLPALNEMFDVTAKRSAAMQMHPPLLIYGLLVAVSLLCSVLAGWAMGASTRRETLHSVCFAAIVALTFYVTVELEYPRQGLVRIDSFDSLLVNVAKSMEPTR